MVVNYYLYSKSGVSMLSTVINVFTFQVLVVTIYLVLILLIVLNAIIQLVEIYKGIYSHCNCTYTIAVKHSWQYLKLHNIHVLALLVSILRHLQAFLINNKKSNFTVKLPHLQKQISDTYHLALTILCVKQHGFATSNIFL